jgi:[ribosomal protein S5]-alanine N-acetyltransferase
MTNDKKKIELVKTTINDLETLFIFQLDKEANYLAAFTSKDPTDKTTYMEKWTKLLTDNSINIQTILFNGKIAGSIAKYEIESTPEITYWIGKDFWGQGIATSALKKFLKIEKVRPIYGRVVFDNFSSQKVLEKCGFKKIGMEKGFANARNKEIEEIIFKLINE